MTFRLSFIFATLPFAFVVLSANASYLFPERNDPVVTAPVVMAAPEVQTAPDLRSARERQASGQKYYMWKRSLWLTWLQPMHVLSDDGTYVVVAESLWGNHYASDTIKRVRHSDLHLGTLSQTYHDEYKGRIVIVLELVEDQAIIANYLGRGLYATDTIRTVKASDLRSAHDKPFSCAQALSH